MTDPGADGFRAAADRDEALARILERQLDDFDPQRAPHAATAGVEPHAARPHRNRPRPRTLARRPRRPPTRLARRALPRTLGPRRPSSAGSRSRSRRPRPLHRTRAAQPRRHRPRRPRRDHCHPSESPSARTPERQGCGMRTRGGRRQVLRELCSLIARKPQRVARETHPRPPP